MLARLATVAVLAILSMSVPSAVSAATIPPEPSATALVYTPPAAVHPQPTAAARFATFTTTPWSGRLWSSTLCGAAAHFYGRCIPAGWTRIQVSNAIADADVIPVGVVLRVPLGVQGTPATPARPAVRAVAPRAVTSGWVHPLPGASLTSCYGWRQSTSSFHQGLDMDGVMGQRIRAARAGVVTSAGWNAGYGRELVIYHGNGVWTQYAHLRAFAVRAGQRVSTGQTVAYVGNSGSVIAGRGGDGSHLHFETRTGAVRHRVNPAPFLRARGVRVEC